MHKKLWGDTAWPQQTQGIFQTIWHTNWGKEKDGRMLRVMGIVFPSNHCAWWGPAFLEMAEQLSACGTWQINSLLWVCGFCFTYLSLFISICGFSRFLLIFSPSLAGGEWRSGWVAFNFSLGLNSVLFFLFLWIYEVYVLWRIVNVEKRTGHLGGLQECCQGCNVENYLELIFSGNFKDKRKGFFKYNISKKKMGN